MRGYKCSGKKHPAKDTAWKWFSLYIRARDCIATTGTLEMCKCITCDKVEQYENIDAGHGIPGRHNSVLFDESIVFGQCRKCNRNGSGERQAFRKKLVEKYSEEWMQMKEQSAKQSVFYSDDYFRIIANIYRLKYKEIIKDYS